MIKDRWGSHGAEQALETEVTCEHEIMRKREERRKGRYNEQTSSGFMVGRIMTFLPNLQHNTLQQCSREKQK